MKNLRKPDADIPDTVNKNMNKPDKTIACGVGEKDDNGIRKHTIRMYGNNVYFRKCVTPDIMDEDGKLLIVLCEKRKDTTNFAEILAIGPDCTEGIKIGDIAILPECSGENKMWRGGLGEDSEGVIDESEIIAVIPLEEKDKK